MILLGRVWMGRLTAFGPELAAVILIGFVARRDRLAAVTDQVRMRASSPSSVKM